MSAAQAPGGGPERPKPVPAATAHPESNPDVSLVSSGPRGLPGGDTVSTATNALVPAAASAVAIQPSRNPGPPLFPGRTPHATEDENNKAALRFARALGLPVISVNNGRAHFSGIHHGIRLDPRAFTERRDIAWVHGLLNPISRTAPWTITPAVPPRFDLYHAVPEAYRVNNVRGPSQPAPNVPLLLDGPPGTFYRWHILPSEIQTMIIRHAMLTPGIYYFSLPVVFFDADAPTAHPRTGRSCNSSWRNWRYLGSVSVQFAHVVNLALTQSQNKRYVDRYRRYPFNRNQHLLAFSVPGRHDWTRRHEEASPDGIYDCFGRGLRLVGLKYEPGAFSCSGPHIGEEPVGIPADGTGSAAEIDPDPWRMRIFGDTDLFCDGPCKGAMCRYVSFFRDAEVMYLMAYIRDSDILQAVKSRHEERSYMPVVAQMLLDNQKAKGLDRFNDASFIWIELDGPAAETLVKYTLFPAWDLVRYLGRYKESIARRLPGQVNPRMEFKVLVTMHNLRWNQRFLR